VETLNDRRRAIRHRVGISAHLASGWIGRHRERNLLLCREEEAGKKLGKSYGQAEQRPISSVLQITAAEKMFRFHGRVHGLQVVSEGNDRQEDDREHGQRHDLRAGSGQQ